MLIGAQGAVDAGEIGVPVLTQGALLQRRGWLGGRRLGSSGVPWGRPTTHVAPVNWLLACRLCWFLQGAATSRARAEHRCAKSLR